MTQLKLAKLAAWAVALTIMFAGVLAYRFARSTAEHYLGDYLSAPINRFVDALGTKAFLLEWSLYAAFALWFAWFIRELRTANHS